MAGYDQPIIIKKVKKNKHAHHGGAWKIAYADFVTAMMAFFLLLWLLSMTTPEQKKGLADYFAPPRISESTSGSGGVMGGQSPESEGAKMAGSPFAAEADAAPPAPVTLDGTQEATPGGLGATAGSEFDDQKASQFDTQAAYEQEFHSAAASIRQAWQAMPEVTDIAENLRVEETEEGLNIEIIDQAGRAMFPEGNKYPYEITRKAIAAIAPILQRLSNSINISGHAAAGGKYKDPKYGSWELTSDRANVVRAILGEFGLADSHVNAVMGRSTTEPFFPNDPYMAANERIKIVVLREPPPVPPDLKP